MGGLKTQVKVDTINQGCVCACVAVGEVKVQPMAIIRGCGMEGVYFQRGRGLGMLMLIEIFQSKAVKGQVVRYFPCPLQNKGMEKPRLAMALIYYSVQFGAIFKKDSSEKNVADINLRTCIRITFSTPAAGPPDGLQVEVTVTANCSGSLQGLSTSLRRHSQNF